MTQGIKDLFRWDNTLRKRPEESLVFSLSFRTFQASCLGGCSNLFRWEKKWTIDIIIDTKEKMPLVFPKYNTINYLRQAMNVGDYGARYDDGGEIKTVFERKSIGDLFSSFTGEKYLNERAKIMRAKERGLRYILAVEVSSTRVRQGFKYSRRPGLAMLRQLMTVSAKYGIELWFCNGREEMAIMIAEYFRSEQRLQEEKSGR